MQAKLQSLFVKVGLGFLFISSEIHASPPQINVTAPVQQKRIVNVFGNQLVLKINNDAASTINANAITVTKKTSCPNLEVNDSDCSNVAPGDSCILQLSSNTPYAPCLITIEGSNTANSLEILIAFSHLGGLVFQENGGRGKVVANVSQQFKSPWTHTNFDIAGTGYEDGSINTGLITMNPACIGEPTYCAALSCRKIGDEWYLPARNELTTIHSALCSNAKTPCNFGDFLSAFYWSSSQYDEYYAWFIDFPSGINFQSNKLFGQLVRCVRVF